MAATMSSAKRPRGQSHHKAKLSDAVVEAMRAKYDELCAAGLAGPQANGGRPKYGYRWFGNKFGCSQWTARDILTYRTRA